MRPASPAPAGHRAPAARLPEAGEAAAAPKRKLSLQLKGQRRRGRRRGRSCPARRAARGLRPGPPPPDSGPHFPAPAAALIGVPRVRPRCTGHAPRSPPNPSNPPRNCQPSQPRRPKTAGWCGILGVPRLAVGRKGAPRPLPRARPSSPRPAPLTGFSAELRPAPGVGRTVPRRRRRLLGGSGRRQLVES